MMGRDRIQAIVRAAQQVLTGRTDPITTKELHAQIALANTGATEREIFDALRYAARKELSKFSRQGEPRPGTGPMRDKLIRPTLWADYGIERPDKHVSVADKRRTMIDSIRRAETIPAVAGRVADYLEEFP